jgi:hypothetical protein
MSYNKWVNGFAVPDAPEAFVTPAKKTLPYTITPIGGPEDLKRWKKEQEVLLAARAIANAKAYAARRITAIKMVEEQNSTLQLTDAEREEIKLRPKGKLAVNAPIRHSEPSQALQDIPTAKSFKERALEAIRKLWG